MSLLRNCLLVFMSALSLSSVFSATAPKPDVCKSGTFTKIYDPSVGEKEQWYINDHCFIQAKDGTWHMFGITRQEPAGDELFFAHATAPALTGPWTKQPHVMHTDRSKGETHVWAPHIIKEGDTYWMFYCAGGVTHARYRLHMATSKDLYTWERHPSNPILMDGYDARDPMVLRVNGKWILYYCATSAPEGGNHVVYAVTSDDLVRWSEKKLVFTHPIKGTCGGPTESPFVVARGGKYYLFVCTNNPYDNSEVYQSDSPLQWDVTNKVGSFPAHAAEVIQTPEGKWYMSRAGWGRGGLYLADLIWND